LKKETQTKEEEEREIKGGIKTDPIKKGTKRQLVNGFKCDGLCETHVRVVAKDWMWGVLRRPKGFRPRLGKISSEGKLHILLFRTRSRRVRRSPQQVLRT